MDVGVAGAGVMGAGVAQSVAASGHHVTLLDLDDEVLGRAVEAIERGCRTSRLVGGPSLDAVDVLSRVRTTTAVEDLADHSVVIENITEDADLKRALYGRLDTVCSPETVLVVNTSAIPITRVAGWTGRPDRVVGVHFMNPVPMKPAVELVPGVRSSAASVETVRALLADMGKRAIEVRDSCGFVSNRVLMLTINEAAFLVHEGVSSAADVDAVFRECFGHPMGPLETADLIGVDTILQSVQVLQEHYADPKYRPCPLLRQMTDAGLLGRKSGRGFYTYDGSGPDLRVPGPTTSMRPSGAPA